MDRPSELKEREIRSFLSFVTEAETERAIDARTFHVAARYDDTDFLEISETFLDADARASVAFLGRDAEQRASVVADLADAGHEIVLHGYRHLKCTDLSYDLAHENLARGLNALEDATGVTPRGFFAPFKQVSQGTLDAAVDLGFEWILGATDGTVPDELTLVHSVYPHDSRLLEGEASPTEAFEDLDAATEPGSTFLFHPNLLEYYGAVPAFRDWIRTKQPETVSAAGPDDVGVVLDCLRPIAVQ